MGDVKATSHMRKVSQKFVTRKVSEPAPDHCPKPPELRCPTTRTYRRVAALPVDRLANDAEGCRQLGSHDHERGVWVETVHVVGVTRCDPVVARSGAKDHRGVDHVIATRDTQALPRGTSSVVIQSDDVTGVRSEEPGKVGLAPPISPQLADDASGNAQLFAAFSRTSDERDRPPLAALERDQRSGVEGDPCLRPSLMQPGLPSREGGLPTSPPTLPTRSKSKSSSTTSTRSSRSCSKRAVDT